MKEMTTVLMIFLLLAYGLLVVMKAMRPIASTLSDYELERRAKNGDGAAMEALARQKYHLQVMTLHRFCEFAFFLSVALLSVAVAGWLLGAILDVVLLVALGFLARLPVIAKFARARWPHHEMLLRKLAQRYPNQIKLLSGLSSDAKTEAFRLHSREELLNILEHADGALEADEKELLERALAFGNIRVREIMTPRKEIISITKDEVLGPLTLTALHKVGRSHLPVVHGGLDRIIGIFAASEFMNTDRQGEVTVEDVMGRRIFYVNESQSLQDALHALLHTKAHLFIVVDKHEKTVGIITISDVIEALFGRARSGKYQQYEDVHAVAKLGAAARETSD